MRLFVTGGAGFIGSNYVRWLLSRELAHVESDKPELSSDKVESEVESIVIYDSLTYAAGLDTLKDVLSDGRVTFVHGDVCDREAVAEAIAGCNAVVHFAAESHVDRSIANPDVFIRTNCFGTNVVCDVARCSDVERFVHVSTDEVYGSITDGSFTEESSLLPTSPYAASKAASDLIALSYYRTYGLNLVLTRSSNIFGPYQFPDKAIPVFITNLLDGEAIPLYGDGTHVRDWCHISDNCAALHTVLCSGEVGEVYNISSRNEISNRDLAERLVKLCHGENGVDPSAGKTGGSCSAVSSRRVSKGGVSPDAGKAGKMVVSVEDRLGHDLRYSMDCSKITSLGWAPQHSFDETLKETVIWYRDNRWWWEPRRVLL